MRSRNFIINRLSKVKILENLIVLIICLSLTACKLKIQREYVLGKNSLPEKAIITSNLQDSTTYGIDSICGVLIDIETRKPIPDGLIWIENTIWNTTSNKYGKFILEVPDSLYTNETFLNVKCNDYIKEKILVYRSKSIYWLTIKLTAQQQKERICIPPKCN
jgi:hypothetical protein